MRPVARLTTGCLSFTLAYFDRADYNLPDVQLTSAESLPNSGTLGRSLRYRVELSFMPVDLHTPAQTSIPALKLGELYLGIVRR